MKMDLVLKYRGKSCKFSGITLKDFTMPVVNNVELDFQIEPAKWFKSLLIESVLIDCDLRNVFWKPKHQLSDTGPTRPVFDDIRLEDSELFNSAMFIVQLSEKKNSKIETVSKEILRILHVHVLPAILLKDEDFADLTNALTVVEDRIMIIGQTMVEKDQELLATENALRDHRTMLLNTEKLDNQGYLKRCSDKFLIEILDDMNHEIRSLTDKLITFQSRVDMTRDVRTDEGKMSLMEWRKKRDEVQSSILKFQCIREAIKNVTSRNKKKKKRKVSVNEAHDAYVAMKDKLRANKSEIRTLFEVKVKATSVREAIIQACNDLETSGESTGCEFSSCGERSSTDILGISNIKPKKWLTLNERIQGILINKSNDISQMYHNFCATTAKKITDFLQERAMFDKKREDNVPFYMTMSEYTIPPRKEKPKQTGNLYENVSTEEPLDSPHKRFTHILKEEVMQHVYDQCQLLVVQLAKQKYSDKKTHTEISLNKVSVYYEQQVYQHLIEHLGQLYEYIHKDDAIKMSSYLENKSLNDIGVVEPWLCGKKENECDMATCAGNSCFKKSLAVVSMRNGSTVRLNQLCEIDDEFNELFDIEAEDLMPPFELCTSPPKDFKCATLTKNKEQRNAAFINVRRELENVTRSKSVMGKLKSIAKASQMISEYATCLKSKYFGFSDENALNAEDMLASTTCALKQIDSQLFHKLYAHVHLVNDFIPPFMMGSIQDWSLTNFYSAFQCISCNMKSDKSQST